MLLQVEMKGLTGTIKFDQHGLRTDFELEVVELRVDGLNKVGVWKDGVGINFTRNYTESYSEIVESLQNKTLVVTTIYVSLRHVQCIMYTPIEQDLSRCSCLCLPR